MKKSNVLPEPHEPIELAELRFL